MTKGEAVRCIEDYELFECGNINGEEGCYICYSESNGKHMVYFPECGEWAELTDKQIETVVPIATDKLKTMNKNIYDN